MYGVQSCSNLQIQEFQKISKFTKTIQNIRKKSKNAGDVQKIQKFEDPKSERKRPGTGAQGPGTLGPGAPPLSLSIWRSFY